MSTFEMEKYKREEFALYFRIFDKIEFISRSGTSFQIKYFPHIFFQCYRNFTKCRFSLNKAVQK